MFWALLTQLRGAHAGRSEFGAARFVSGRAGARRNMRARPGVRPLQRFKLGQVSVLGLADTTARRARRPERLWRGALCKRLRETPAEHASPAERVAVAALQTQAGECSGPC